MASCPECGKGMVKTETKKKGVFVLKHESPEDQKACGVKFIPVDSRKKAGATDGGQKGPERTEETGGGGYGAAIASESGKTGNGGRAGRKSKKPIQQPAQQPAQPNRTAEPNTSRGGSKKQSYGEWLRDEYGI